MSNIIQIKRGSGKPDQRLHPYELGYDIDEGYLYIGPENGLEGSALDLKVKYSTNAEQATNATNAVNAANAEKANQLTNSKDILVDLASTSAASFDGTVGINPGVTGTLPIANGGTGLTANPSVLINLGSGNAANILAATPRPGVTGTLPIAKGGTGLTASPSMLTNLGSTTAASILAASPRPGVTGTLPIANGGTGLTASPSMLTNLGSTTAANVLAASPRPGVTGTLPVANGGTGGTTAAAARGKLGTPTVETKTASLAKNGSSTLTFTNNVKCVFVSVYYSPSSEAKRCMSGVWDANNSGYANNLYALYNPKDYRCTVSISGKQVTLSNASDVTLKFTATALTA